MALNPCLYVTGNAEEALEHYRSALGGEIQIARYEDAPPGQPIDPSWKQKVMYGSVRSSLGTVACIAHTQPMSNTACRLSQKARYCSLTHYGWAHEGLRRY